MARDYAKEYAASRRPDRRADNIARKRARRLMIKEKGAAALKGKEVDHKKMLAEGGSNARSNLAILTIAANRKKQPKRK
jgi:5-methylcytosine-specific restriction endonuclease McrA